MGFKTEDILKQCERTSFFQGKSLYASKRITQFQIKNETKLQILTGKVAEGIQNSYQVRVVVDLEKKEEKITEYDCECESFKEKKVLCKHCAAIAFKLVNVLLEQQLNQFKPIMNVSQDSMEDTSHSEEAKKTMISPSSLPIRKVLNYYNGQGMGKWKDAEYGKVELEFELHSDDVRKQISIEIKVGTEKKYVVKNIFGFIRNVMEGNVYTYGKFLSFYHEREAFSSQALLLLDLLLECARELGWQNPKKYLTKAYEETRTMPLTPYYLERLLELCIGNYVRLDSQMTKVLQDDPQIPMKIIRKTEGVDVRFEKFEYYYGARQNMVLLGNKLYVTSPEYTRKVMPFLEIVTEDGQRDFSRYFQRKNETFVSESDFQVFYVTVYEKLKDYFAVDDLAGVFENMQIDQCEIKLYLEAEDDRIVCRGESVYGVMSYNLGDNINQNGNYRDLEKEMHALALIQRYFSEELDAKGDAQYYLENDEQLYNLISEGMEQLEQIGELYVHESIRGIKIQRPPQMMAGVRIQGDLLQLDIQMEGLSKKEITQILSAYEQKKKYVRLKSGDLIQLGEQAEMLDDMIKGLGVTPTQLAAGSVQLPQYRALFLGELMNMKQYENHFSHTNEFSKLIKSLDDSQQKHFELPKEIQADLRQYQLKGFQWLCHLAAFGMGGILADDMGLGKTLQVICWLTYRKKRSLIVCPASLVYNWENELKRFSPQMEYRLIVGDVNERKEIIEQCSEMENVVLITSYDLLKRDAENYNDIAFDNMVIDEAQYIKNYNTQVARAVKGVNATHRVALTGTPIENRLSDLWSIFDFIMPGFLFSYARFKTEYEIPIMSSQSEKHLERLKKMITPFLLRRRKQEVLTELPDKLEEIVYTKMTEEQEKIYYARYYQLVEEVGKKTDREFGKEQIQILSEITRLRQICCEPGLCYDKYKGGSGKVEVFMEKVLGAVENGSRILVFSQFATMLEVLNRKLQKTGISTMVLTGSTSKEKRKEMVERFQACEVDVFFISLKAGGTGLNLTAADVVIHFDPWWNIAVQNQATDRAHRIGQKNVVTVMQLVTKNTIEERIIELQEKKRELVENVISGEHIASSSITKEEIMELLVAF